MGRREDCYDYDCEPEVPTWADCDEPRPRRRYYCRDGMCGGCERCVPGIDDDGEE